LAAAPVASAANASAVASNSATRPKLKKKPAQGEASVWELIGVSFGAGAALFALQWAILRNNRQRMIG
jgi:hypothetical protein